VLRELLETTEAKATERYELLLQRLSLLEAPTSETVDYLRGKVERPGDGDAMAAAHSLGSAIGKRSIATAEIEASAAVLRRGLAAATSPGEQVAWLGTLGNAGRAEDVPLLAEYAESSEPSVRAAVADALRKSQTDASEAVLDRLVSDPEPRVQKRALHALARYTLAPERVQMLGELVATGRLQPASFAALTALLESNRHQSAAVAPVVDAILAQPISDRHVLLRLRALQRSL
jgi:hypothetical protein